MKKIFFPPLFLALIIISFYGCAPTVEYTTSDRLYMSRPLTVAVLPAIWEAGEAADAGDIKRLFRLAAVKRLTALNYTVVPVDEVDKKYSELGDGWFKGKTPGETARALGADSVLFIHITKWKSNMVVSYAYLKIKARFDLYAKNSKKLWSAAYGTKDSDIRLDRSALELAIIKVYEPRIERFVSDVFATLPRHKEIEEKERFFDWLP